ncbi:hypothetical protein PRZ48_006101 [Zasmidium cellare]|uniref:Uncharacterized protein n=1 Tax=Zasmidium cellare TaxID=395010 RepID=A0ABR0EN45_ZASCE|nr:hypothetical protein PRZ48_006101 [Zasmidium cellare]
MSTIPIKIPTPANPSTPINLHLDITTITSYEDGLDPFDGPLWYDAMNPISVQLEAEGHPHPHTNHCASPVERVKHEEELMMETVAALWDSEIHGAEARQKRRRSLLSKSVCCEEGAEKEGEGGEIAPKMCKMGSASGTSSEGRQCCKQRSSSGHVDGVAV